MAMVRNENLNKIFPQKRIEKVYVDLTDTRIITKNLVYVIGLSARMATKEILMKREYFGQYGTITKVVVNSNKAYNQNNPKGPSYSAYVTYSKPYEASIAILSLDNIIVDDHLIRASFGTTKYCSFYMKKIECTNKDCLFLHRQADPNDIISREDLNSNKNIFLEQQIYAMRIADIFNPEIKKKILSHTIKKFKNVLPSPESIFNKEIVHENDPIFQKNKINKKKYYEDANNFNDIPQYKNHLRNIFDESNIVKETKIINQEIKEITTKDKLNNVVNINRKSSFFNLADSTSTSSKEDINYTISANEDRNNMQNLDTPKMNNLNQKIFYNRDSSRFNFNPKNKENNIVEVPDFIQNLIVKKSSSFILSRSMKHLEDLCYLDKTLESEYKNQNPWAQFILEHKSESINPKDDDKDLIDDFDYINNLVLHKCHSYK